MDHAFSVVDHHGTDCRLGYREDNAGSGYGTFADILIGIAGAIVGGWIMRAIGFEGQGGTIYTILVAIVGAVVLTWLYRLIISRGRASIGSAADRGRGDSNLRKVA